MRAGDWRSINNANWESRVPVHLGPGGYDLAAFDDAAYLSSVIQYDLPRLGDVNGLDVVHLQCHIGTDTVSLSRLGTASVVGLDFSSAAIEAARSFAARVGAPAEFVLADAYDAVDVLGSERFDLVYTGVGAICWLPSIARWAEVVAGLLRPGGRLFMREGHPVVWSLDDPRADGLLVVKYPYFETEGTVFTEPVTYGGEAEVASPDIVNFNHGLGEIFGALWSAGLELVAFDEHRELPWNALGDAMIPSSDHRGEYVLANDRDLLPLSYTLQARKPTA